jgi:hypothetical protein
MRAAAQPVDLLGVPGHLDEVAARLAGLDVGFGGQHRFSFCT